jgi:hypothetical protein
MRIICRFLCQTFIFFGVIGAVAVPASAETCEDLWLARNAIFDDAGYCFGSELGMSIFNNDDCITKSPDLSGRERNKVARIKEYERQYNCRVDSSARRLDLFLLDIRLELIDQPVSDGQESTCIGLHVDGQLPLYAGKSESSRIIGFLRDGDNVNIDHEGEDGWSFASSVLRDEEFVDLLGWHKGEFDQCRNFAG